LCLNVACHATQHDQQTESGESAATKNWFVVFYHMC
jgi:hypothetical protein